MTEKEFLETFMSSILVTGVVELAYRFSGEKYTEENLDAWIDAHLENHHKEYYEVEFVKIPTPEEEQAHYEAIENHMCQCSACEVAREVIK